MLHASLIGARRLVSDLGHYSLMAGPVRRALVEPAASISDDALRLLLAYYARRLGAAGLNAGPSGNLSARCRDGVSLLITRRGANKSRHSPADLCRLRLDATPGERNGASSEFAMHRACYLADVATGAVIHTHAPALTAIGIRGLDLADTLPEANLALGGVRVVPFAASGSQALADAVGGAVTDGAGMVILERHGVVSVGATPAIAADRMEFGELSARTVLLATGGSPCV